MPFPLGSVLAAAPGLVSAATDIIRLIRQRKAGDVAPTQDKLGEIATLLEQQALVIEELAQNNRNLALAVRNNRIVAVSAMAIAGLALVLAIWQ